MTVFQNVAYGLKFKKLSRHDMDRKVTELLRLVHLENFKDRYPSELSGGQQQRVALARALVVEPQILLMDEPLSNLDANLREEMRFEIRRLHEEFGITTVYVTHDQAEAMATSDRIAVLNGGRMVQAGSPAEIFDRPRTRFVAEFVGKANILAGHFDGDSRIVLGDGLKIRAAFNTQMPAAPGEASVCLRPHNILLTADTAEADAFQSRKYNLFTGIVQRRIYFGESADYTIDLAPHPITLRVVGAPSRLYDRGQKIFALAHPEHCVVVGQD
jgi:iron(III) transport system ATP-binding protein